MRTVIFSPKAKRVFAYTKASGIINGGGACRTVPMNPRALIRNSVLSRYVKSKHRGAKPCVQYGRTIIKLRNSASGLDNNGRCKALKPVVISRNRLPIQLLLRPFRDIAVWLLQLLYKKKKERKYLCRPNAAESERTGESFPRSSRA